jgi:hypothetical protein
MPGRENCAALTSWPGLQNFQSRPISSDRDKKENPHVSTLLKLHKSPISPLWAQAQAKFHGALCDEVYFPSGLNLRKFVKAAAYRHERAESAHCDASLETCNSETGQSKWRATAEASCRQRNRSEQQTKRAWHGRNGDSGHIYRLHDRDNHSS